MTSKGSHSARNGCNKAAVAGSGSNPAYGLHATLNMLHMPCSMLCLQAAADVLAMASLEVDLSGIQEGEVSNSPQQ